MKEPHRALIALTLLAILVTATAVAIGGRRGERENLAAEGKLESELPDFDHVYTDARAVRSVGIAAGKLAFAPVAPPSAGTPRSIYVHGSVSDRARQGMALVYDDPAYGRYVVREERVEMTQGQLESLPDRCHAADLCEGAWKVITLPDGTRALLVAGPGSTSVAWLRGKTRFFVLGPPDSFSIPAAEAVAAKFAGTS